MYSKFLFITILNILSVCLASAQTNDSILSKTLDDVTVHSHRYTSSVKSSKEGEYTWKLPFLNNLPKIMGNADPIHYAQMLPGVQTNSEYKAGINIQGCENSHNAILLEGVPIYNPNHLLGFFSVFNATHFSTMSVRKYNPISSSANRLGGTLEIFHDEEIPKSTEGDLTVGLISSQGTIRVPIGDKTKITLSLRASYINLLYSSWLTFDDASLNYSFADANFTLHHKLNNKNTLIVDYYGGFDHADVEDYYSSISFKSKWGNHVGALHWKHKNNKYKIHSTIFTTNYLNQFNLNIGNLALDIPSSISDIGIKSALEHEKWNVGLNFTYHNIHPQNIDLQGGYNIKNPPQQKQDSWEATLFAEYKHRFLKYYTINLGSKLVGYFTHSSSFFNADPTVSVAFDNYRTKVSLNYTYAHQYLFQTGFSNVGLPIEFWFSADENNAPQSTHSVMLSASTSLFSGRYRLHADLFYKKLYNQIEYRGNVFDVANTQYSLQDNLLHGHGTNYGFSVMAHKCTGKLTGWISYTYTHAKRFFKELDEQTPFAANHERPHDLKAVIMYSPWKHWDFGATTVFASGTPFTKPKSIAYFNGNIITQYEAYNSSRLRPYFRLDVSANYKWSSRLFKEQGINLSIHNVTCTENHLFWKVKIKEGGFAYRPVSFIVNILPSISYYCKF